jgi:pentatricopeptide repeat protein
MYWIELNDKVLGHGDKGRLFPGFKGTYVENGGNYSSLAIEVDEARSPIMVISLSKSNKVSSASSLYRRMEDSVLQPTLHACNSLISCFMRRVFIGDALNVF